MFPSCSCGCPCDRFVWVVVAAVVVAIYADAALLVYDITDEVSFVKVSAGRPPPPPPAASSF
jgi:hypothetical protein